MRPNIQPIVAATLAQAARSGTERDWVGMREYQAIASQFSQLGGLAAAVGTAAVAGAPAAATMTATAG